MRDIFPITSNGIPIITTSYYIIMSSSINSTIWIWFSYCCAIWMTDRTRRFPSNSFWMYFKSIWSASYFFPPFWSICPIWSNRPIISRAITLPYPWSINTLTTWAFPSFFRLIWWNSQIVSACWSSSCWISNLNFICSVHIYLQSVESKFISVCLGNSFSCFLIKAMASSILLTRIPPCLINPVTYRFW